jgi:hypothetical protein
MHTSAPNLIEHNMMEQLCTILSRVACRNRKHCAQAAINRHMQHVQPHARAPRPFLAQQSKLPTLVYNAVLTEQSITRPDYMHS